MDIICSAVCRVQIGLYLGYLGKFDAKCPKYRGLLKINQMKKMLLYTKQDRYCIKTKRIVLLEMKNKIKILSYRDNFISKNNNSFMIWEG